MNQNIEHLLGLLHELKEKEPAPITHQHKQAALTIEAFEDCVQRLIMEHQIPMIIIQALLVNLWVLLEAPVRGISHHKIDRWSMPLHKVVQKMMYNVQSTLDSLPYPNQTPEEYEFGEAVRKIKEHISDDFFTYDLSEEEFLPLCAFVVVHISKVMDTLIEGEVHPQIISNVMFARWLRLMTIQSSIPEIHYQKMEYYFEEVIAAARNYVPKLFHF